MVKRLSAILAALLLVFALASAETAWDDAFGLDQFDDGYDGNWIQIDALSMEFCLPDGWGESSPSSDAAFTAVNAAGDAALRIRSVAENVSDLAKWGAANLKSSQKDEANFYDVLVTEGEDALSVYLIIQDEDVIAFDFKRKSPSALPRQFALQIVGSACALWDDDDVPVLEGDEDFDFGEAFEADLG